MGKAVLSYCGTQLIRSESAADKHSLVEFVKVETLGCVCYVNDRRPVKDGMTMA